MGMAAPLYYTADMVRALPDDGNRYEVVYGELLVTPAPRLQHQELVRRLLVALSRYLEANPVAHALASPADKKPKASTVTAEKDKVRHPFAAG